MGFLDKAKKLAEQAQSKLDEVQKQVNTSGSSGTMQPSGPIVEYDKHGRPIPQQPQETTGGPQGDPLMGGHHAPPPAPTGPVLDPSAPSFGDPLGSPAAPLGGDPLGAPPSAPPAPAAPSSSPPPASVAPPAPVEGGWSSAAPPSPPAPPAAAAPPMTPGVPPTEPPTGPPAPVESASPPPAPPGVPATDDDDRNPPSYAPPKLTGGDPLAG